jgi:hypothetical protein
MSGRRGLLQKIGEAVDNRFIFTVKTDNAGTSANDQFQIIAAFTGNTIGTLYDIETSDGYIATGITLSHTITFPSGAGTHTVYISGVLPRIYFNNGFDRLKFLTIENWGMYGIGSTDQQRTFRGCENLVINATDTPNTFAPNNFFIFMQRCFDNQKVPLFDYSNSTNFSSAWFENNITIVPPEIRFNSATICDGIFRNNINLVDFPPNIFDSCLCTNFNNAFSATNLSQASIDNVLVSIESNGTSGGTFFQSGGSAPSATGETAIDALRGRGWTVTVTGGY